MPTSWKTLVDTRRAEAEQRMKAWRAKYDYTNFPEAPKVGFDYNTFTFDVQGFCTHVNGIPVDQAGAVEERKG